MTSSRKLKNDFDEKSAIFFFQVNISSSDTVESLKYILVRFYHKLDKKKTHIRFGTGFFWKTDLSIGKIEKWLAQLSPKLEIISAEREIFQFREFRVRILQVSEEKKTI